MAYDVHITRASEWSQNEGQEITREEWLVQVQSDPELALDLQNGSCFAVWSKPSQNPDPWIDWFKGNLFTKNPDRALLGKMLQIAARLGAKGQGDDGEEYRSTLTGQLQAAPAPESRRMRTKRTKHLTVFRHPPSDPSVS